MSSFELNSSFKPSGDQEQAIGKLLKSLEAGNKHQGLLGVTGSGKTFTMANLIARMNRPTLVISHNKTLAAQLHSELKSFFPNNAVDYYVSYFDYYQPEAYIASSDTYIEKDSAINDELDRLSLNAMNSPDDTEGCDCGGIRFLHLRPVHSGGLQEPDAAHARGGCHGPGRVFEATGETPVRAAGF